ncbi:MAG TPA: hypothetical protein VF515_21545 [Candidatus Binatia bacterium]
MTDTPDAVRTRYRVMLMRRPGAERLKMACDMFDAARRLGDPPEDTAPVAGHRSPLGGRSPARAAPFTPGAALNYEANNEERADGGCHQGWAQ